MTAVNATAERPAYLCGMDHHQTNHTGEALNQRRAGDGPVNQGRIAKTHRALPDFRQIWDRDAVPVAERVDAERRRLQQQLNLRIFVAVLVGVAAIIGMLASAPNTALRLVSIFGLFASVFGGVLWLGGPAGALFTIEKRMKAEILAALCAPSGMTFDVDARRFAAGAFDVFSFSVPEGVELRLEDHLSGSYDGTGFDACEARVHDPKHRSHDEQRLLLLRLDCPKRFAGAVFLFSRAKGDVQNFLKTLGRPAGQRRRLAPEPVKLEDPRLMARFSVYATDQIEVRYLLTPSFMERLAALRDRFGGEDIEAVFIDGRLLVAVGAGHNHFEVGDVLDSPDAATVPERLASELGAIFDLIDSLRHSDRTLA